MTEGSIKVGMADMNITTSPGVLVTLGLGSCIGLCLYDPVVKVAGMIHIMLPNSANGLGDKNPAKYANTGIPLLIEQMVKKGANRSRLWAKMAGGAQMFAFKTENEIIQIGKKNIEATRIILEEMGIKLIAEDVGGSNGRTIEFDAENGNLLIKTIGLGVKTI